MHENYLQLFVGIEKEEFMKNKSKIISFFQDIEYKYGNLKMLKKIYFLINCYYESKINKVPKDEYFKYDFFYRSKSGRATFCVYPKRKVFFDYFNEKEESKYFDNKVLFASKFKEFMCRDEIDLRTIEEDKFVSFVQVHKKVFLKPIDGHYGIGTKIIEIENNTDVLQLFKLYSGKQYVAEEFICQAKEFSEFNDTSVNSLRVMTFVRKNGEVDIIPYAAIRMGRKGKVADNFHNDGISAIIDSNTGYVITVGLDRSGKRWVIHPDSKKAIVGFKVPYWDKVCECAKKAALICPSVRFVGWDIAMTEGGKAIIIEGNSRPDPDVIQAVDGIGKWYIFEKYLREER